MPSTIPPPGFTAFGPPPGPPSLEGSAGAPGAWRHEHYYDPAHQWDRQLRHSVSGAVREDLLQGLFKALLVALLLWVGNAPVRVIIALGLLGLAVAVLASSALWAELRRQVEALERW